MPTQFAYFSILFYPSEIRELCWHISLYVHASEIRELCSRISLYVLCERNTRRIVFAYFSICSIRVKYANCVRVFLYRFCLDRKRELRLRISLYYYRSDISRISPY